MAGAGEPVNGFPNGTPGITTEGSTERGADEGSTPKGLIKERRK